MPIAMTSPDASVAVMRTILKGRPEVHAEFSELLAVFFASKGAAIAGEALISVIPALPSELPVGRGHVVALPD